MRANHLPKIRQIVRHIEFFRRRSDDPRQFPVASMGDIREEMMGRVRIGSSRDHVGNSAVRIPVERCEHGMGGPVMFDDALVVGFGEKRLFGKMCADEQIDKSA